MTPEVGVFEKEEPVKEGSQPSGRRPLVTSYDSGYEHSLEHWLNVQQLVEADEKGAHRRHNSIGRSGFNLARTCCS